jgi:predicted murein hydrolase (TIGR00659 family)
MEFWVYFSAKPLFWLTVTTAVFLFACWVNKMAKGSALLHPVIVSMTVLIAFLVLTDTDYTTYFEGAQFIHFLIGPATVALAVPLYDHRKRIKEMWLHILVACVIGALVAMLSAILIAKWFGLPNELLLTLAPKSVTTPIAIGIAEKIGGISSMAAGFVLITGAMGTLVAPWVFRLLMIKDDAVKGFSLGLSAHGFGTAAAFEISAVAGAFSGLAMGLTGLITAFLVPIVVHLLGITPV